MTKEELKLIKAPIVQQLRFTAKETLFAGLPVHHFYPCL